MQHKMKLLFCLLALLVFAVPAFAIDITVDGNLDDWGLNALSGSSDWSQDSTWFANQGVYFVVEDNNDPSQLGLPGYYASGVHMKGAGASGSPFTEPSLILNANGKKVASPYAGEKYDVEALYLTWNTSHIFVATVLSMPQEGYGRDGNGNPAYAHDETPGDLALNFAAVPGEVLGYEYGIKVSPWQNVGAYNIGDIVYLPNWSFKGYTTNEAPAPKHLPDEMQNSAKNPALPGTQVVGQADIAYTNSWIQHSDFGADNWVMEMAIPRSAVNYYNAVGLNNVMIAQNCQNDNIYVPEFPTIAISLGAIIGLVFVIISSKKE